MVHDQRQVARSSPRAGAAGLLGRGGEAGIECPLGDFFGLGFGKYVEYKSAPIAIGGVKALNCYWPMPFSKSVRLTMTNEGSQPVGSCYFNIDYRLDDQPATDARYFHTHYHQAFPVSKGEDIDRGDHGERAFRWHVSERDGQQRRLVGRRQ